MGELVPISQRPSPFIKSSLPLGSRVLSYYEFAKALIEGTLDELRAPDTSLCPFCKQANPTGHYVRHKGRSYCVGCGPRERRCPECKVSRSITNFRLGRRRGETP